MSVNSVAENLKMWDQLHAWPEDGDEWNGQAAVCGVPYADWKQALVDRLITPYAAPGSTVIEVAPGHGRWTGYLAERAGRLILVDLSPSCLERCRERYAEHKHLEFHQTDGSSLPDGLDGTVDLVWSFDAFVHIGPKEIASYLRHIQRVLKPGGVAVIHHGNRRHSTLWLAPMRRLGPAWTRLYRRISIGPEESADGWRSPMSAKLFRRLAGQAGLQVVDQIQRWGEGERYGVPRHNDKVSILRRPG
jgi:ubiquinone/menaquinone biosynthesis C-methylase UbiE